MPLVVNPTDYEAFKKHYGEKWAKAHLVCSKPIPLNKQDKQPANA